MGEDRGGTNVVEGQTGLPVSGTVKKKKKKCCMAIEASVKCVFVRMCSLH